MCGGDDVVDIPNFMLEECEKRVARVIDDSCAVI